MREATASPSHQVPILLPTPPEPAATYSFPLIGTIAPVLASLVIWLVTQSPFALIFALLGPIMAIGSLADSSWHGRRHRRRSRLRYEDEVTAVTVEIEDHHRIERAELQIVYPDLADVLDLPRSGVGWHTDFDGGVRAGSGRAVSTLRLEGTRVPRHPLPFVRDATNLLFERSGRIDSVPIVVDASSGVAFVGPPLSAAAAARAYVIRLARALPPDRWTIAAPDAPEWRWLAELPHARAAPSHHGSGRLGFVPTHLAQNVLAQSGLAQNVLAQSSMAQSGAGSTGWPPGTHRPDAGLIIAIATNRDEVPQRCRVVVDVTIEPGTVDDHGGGRPEFRPEFVSVEQAREYARALHELATREGVVTDALELPVSVRLSALSNGTGTGTGTGTETAGLCCEVGVTDGGPWKLDLVADGPHAVVGGTTGSGKSELLTSWILAMASRRTPEELTFLLVDFKGGATFGAIARLPHSVGVITDLDHSNAVRALTSLRAEVLHRERTIAAAGVRSIDELHAIASATDLARLVIVVDEFAALATDYPDLHLLFADLAARGRSLGMHLLLCTQRPAASLRDAILANCTLRICLRVNDAADSVAVIGTTAAAALPRISKGRALVSVGGDPPVRVQVAIASGADVDAVMMGRTSVATPIRRPWCDPLPTQLDLTDVPPVSQGEGIAFGLVDLPARQRQEPAVWNPHEHGSLLVLGGFSSGKSTLLATIAARSADAELIPRGVEGAWDAVMAAVSRIDSADRSSAALLFDDIDSLVARFAPDHQMAFVDAVTRVLRDGPRLGTIAALSARTMPSILTSAASACDTRIVLRMADRSEHVIAGGLGSDYDPRMPPGGGFWRGDRVQVAWVSPTPDPPPTTAPELRFPAGALTAIVSTAPHDAIDALSPHVAAGRVRIQSVSGMTRSDELTVSTGGEHLVLVGDLDAWNAAWSLVPSVRAHAHLAFHGCSVADFRSITRSRRLPPALDGTMSHVWLLAGDAVTRAVLARVGS